MSFNGADSELSHPAVVRERNWRLNVGGSAVPSWFCLFSLSSPPVAKAMFFCTCPLNVTELGLLYLSVWFTMRSLVFLWLKHFRASRILNDRETAWICGGKWWNLTYLFTLPPRVTDFKHLPFSYQISMVTSFTCSLTRHLQALCSGKLHFWDAGTSVLRGERWAGM